MLDLKLDEVELFESLAGMSWSKAAKMLDAGMCSQHRLYVRNCRDCQQAGGLCPKHQEVFESCTDCVGIALPAKGIGALAYVYARRAGEARTHEEYAAETPYVEMLALVGNAVRGAAQSSPAGSPRSSTGSRASRTRRSGRSR